MKNCPTSHSKILGCMVLDNLTFSRTKPFRFCKKSVKSSKICFLEVRDIYPEHLLGSIDCTDIPTYFVCNTVNNEKLEGLKLNFANCIVIANFYSPIAQISLISTHTCNSE